MRLQTAVGAAIAAIITISAPSRPHALEVVELMRAMPVDESTRALIDRFKNDQRLTALGITIKEANFPAGGNLPDAFKGKSLRLGLVSLDTVISANLVRNSALVNALLQPGQFAETTELFKLQDTPLGDAIIAEIGRDRLFTPIAYWSRGQSTLVTNTPIRSADDFKGRKVRTISPGVASATVVELGASAVQMASSEAITALRTGAFDTAEFTTPTAEIAIRQGVTKAVGTQYRPLVGFLLAGRAGWDELSELQKITIAQAARGADEAARESTLRVEASLLSAARAQNFTVVNLAQSDFAGFQKIGSTALSKQFGPRGDVILNALAVERKLTSQTIVPERSAPAAAPSSQPPVLFITDRNDEGGSNAQTRFGSKELRDIVLTCGSVTYSDTAGRPIGKSFAGAIQLAPALLPAGDQKCIDFIAQSFKQSGRARLMLFIHGFNNTFDDAVRRAITSANDIGYDGMVLVWSWPSEGSVVSYMRDEDTARRTQRTMSSVVISLLQRDEIKRVDIVAHSMGTRIALYVLDWLRVQLPAANVGAVVLAAADEAQTIVGDTIGDLVRLAPKLGGMRTLYAATHDRPLQVSSYLHDHDRAGLGGDKLMVLKGLESVDATNVEAGYLMSLVTRSHSHVFDVPKAIADLKRLLADGKPAGQRNLTHQERNGIAYWLIPD